MDAEEEWRGYLLGTHPDIARGVLDFTALGDAVNTAARLASEAGPGELLVSDAAAEAAGLTIGGEGHRTLQLEGRAQPVGATSIHP